MYLCMLVSIPTKRSIPLSSYQSRCGVRSMSFPFDGRMIDRQFRRALSMFINSAAKGKGGATVLCPGGKGKRDREKMQKREKESDFFYSIAFYNLLL